VADAPARPRAKDNALNLIVFDCDGTLVDSQHMIVAAMGEAYQAHGLAVPSRARVLSIVGLSLSEAFRVLGEGEPDFPVTSLIERYRDAFFALRAAEVHLEPLFPGAREAVQMLGGATDTVLAIATGKSQRGVRAVLARHGLLDYFQVIKTADDCPSKPHPGMVVEAMREVGAAAGETVVIGDTTYDMAMAVAAGVNAIGVSWGYHPVERLRQAGASAVIEDFRALKPALEALWSSR
jgi:phosphoglycolate phosphatase